MFDDADLRLFGYLFFYIIQQFLNVFFWLANTKIYFWDWIYGQPYLIDVRLYFNILLLFAFKRYFLILYCWFYGFNFNYFWYLGCNWFLLLLLYLFWSLNVLFIFFCRDFLLILIIFSFRFYQYFSLSLFCLRIIWVCQGDNSNFFFFFNLILLTRCVWLILFPISLFCCLFPLNY